jgi:hypothetical protein
MTSKVQRLWVLLGFCSHQYLKSSHFYRGLIGVFKPRLNRDADTKWHLVRSSLAVALVSTLCIAGVANANLITNGDFYSGTLAGWESSKSNVTVTDCENIPLVHENIWDLTVWESRMDGNFAFVEGGEFLTTRTDPVPGSSFFTLSMDYAVAWANPTGLHPYGYFYIQTFGETDGRRYSLSYSEIAWTAVDGLEKDIFTGALYTQNFIHWPDLMFDNISVQIGVFNMNQSFTQIVGLDNINLSVMPVPEPSTLFLVGFGLAFFAKLARKKEA